MTSIAPPPAPGRRPVGTRRGRGVGRRLLLILGSSVLAGVLLALVILPVGGGVGLVAKQGADAWDDLPNQLIEPTLAQRSVMTDAAGTPIAYLKGAEDRVVVPLSSVPEVMRTAIIDIEDSRFYDHNGVDFRGLLRAAVRDLQTGTWSEGASTLTQQYVKNVLLESATTEEEKQAAIETSAERKLREARYAIALEKRLTKDQILERYLNIAYFGNGVYGIGLAAQHYFGVPVEQLTLPQAAFLAGLVKNQAAYDPVAHPQAALERRNTVIDRMVQLGHLDAATGEATKALPLGTVPPPAPPGGDACEGTVAPFFCDYVRSSLLNDKALGASAQDRARRVYEGGLTIKTTLDPKIQAAAQQAVDSALSSDNRVATAVVIVRPGTGEVLAMAVNRVYGGDATKNETKVPLPTTAAFQPGSTFKTFTLVSALEQGIGLSTTMYAPPCYVSKVYNLGGAGGGRSGSCPGGFQNAEDGEGGTFTLSRAFAESVNTYFIQLEERVGVMNVAETATRLGVPQERLAKVGPNDGSLTLGSYVVSPLDMATAYATIAAHGLRCDPRFATDVTDPAGKQVAITQPQPCQQVVDPAVADTAASVMRGVITSGTGTNAAIGRPAAGKTGTTDGFTAAWFVGFTPQLAAAVEMGDPRGSVQHPLRSVQADGRTWSVVYGGDVPARIWGRAMKAAHDGLPVESFSPADPGVSRGKTFTLPDVTGLSQAEATSRLSALGLTVNVDTTRRPLGVPNGVVGATSPRAGATVSVGTTVRLTLGNGDPDPSTVTPTPTGTPDDGGDAGEAGDAGRRSTPPASTASPSSGASGGPSAGATPAAG